MWLLSGRCYCKTRLDGKTIVITGANCGIGKATVLELVKKGGRVIMACRDQKKANEAIEDIGNELKGVENVGELILIKLDLSSIQSIRQCAQHILDTEKKIDILINNAGVVFGPRMLTADGFEMHIGVNHLGHFLFTSLLLPRIIRSAPSRIVNVSSSSNYYTTAVRLDDLHWEKRKFSSFFAYAQSKLSNVLFNAELAKRLEGTGVTTYALHPGLVLTNSARHSDNSLFYGAQFFWEKICSYFVKTPEQGAQTTVHCAVSPELANETGLYYSDCKKSTCNPLVNNLEFRKKFWDESVRQLGLGDWNPFTVKDNGSLPPMVK